MLPAKPQWQKLIHWVSPLLVLSLGLHGLVLLMPIPKKPEIREDLPEPELLEPIRVSALPQPSLPDAAAGSAAANPTAIAPPSPSPSPPAAVPPAPERSPAPRPPAPDSTPASPVAPPAENLAETGSAGNSGNTNLPSGKPTKPDLVPQTYSDVGTTSGEASAALSDLLSFNADAAGDSPPLKFVKHPLPLSFPAADYCFKDYPDPPASVVVVVENAGTDLAVIDGGLTQKTGYAAIDKWVDKSIFPT